MNGSDAGLNPGACANCGAALAGAYCASCGQPARSLDITLRDLLREGFEALTNLDGAVLRSFRGLLWAPGRMTREYLAGRRARYLPPLRLYLLCSLAFVVTRGIRDRVTGLSGEQLLTVQTTIQADDGTATTVTADSAVRLVAADTMAFGSGTWARMIRRAVVEPAAFRQRVRELAPRAFFVLVPAFAGLLALGYRHHRWGFARHLVVALHLHAMGFLVFALAQFAGLLPGVRGAVGSVGAVATLGLVPFALAATYGTRLLPAVGRGTLLLVPYLVLVAAATVAVLLAALAAGA